MKTVKESQIAQEIVIVSRDQDSDSLSLSQVQQNKQYVIINLHNIQDCQMKKESKNTVADKKPATTSTTQKAQGTKKPAQANDLKKTSPTTPASSSKTTASKLNTTNNSKVDPVKAGTKPSQTATSPKLPTGSSKLAGSGSKGTSSALKSSTASKSGETSPKQKGKSLKTSQSVITQDETMNQQANESSFVVIENPSEVNSELAVETLEAEQESKEEKIQVSEVFQEQKVKLRKESSDQPTDTVGTFVEESPKVEQQEEVDERIEESGNNLQIEELEPTSKIMEDQSPSKLSEEINCEPEYQFDTRQYRESMSSEDNELVEIKPTFVDTTAVQVSIKEQEKVEEKVEERQQEKIEERQQERVQERAEERVQERVEKIAQERVQEMAYEGAQERVEEKVEQQIDQRLQQEAEAIKAKDKLAALVKEPLETAPLIEEKIQQNVPLQSQVVEQPLAQTEEIIEQTIPEPLIEEPDHQSFKNLLQQEEKIQEPVLRNEQPAIQPQKALAVDQIISQSIQVKAEVIQPKHDEIVPIPPLLVQQEKVLSRYQVLKREREFEEELKRKREETERAREKQQEKEREEFARRKSQHSTKPNASKREEKVEEQKPKETEKPKPKPTIKEQPQPEVQPPKKPKNQSQTHYSKNQRISRSIDNEASLKQSLITIAEQKDRNGSKQCCTIM